MTYSKLSHEARELVHYIENNEQALLAIKQAKESNQGLMSYIEQCTINYKSLNADVDNFIFNKRDKKQAKSYFLNNQEI